MYPDDTWQPGTKIQKRYKVDNLLDYSIIVIITTVFTSRAPAVEETAIPGQVRAVVYVVVTEGVQNTRSNEDLY